jgi:hypothetical protein
MLKMLKNVYYGWRRSWSQIQMNFYWFLIVLWSKACFFGKDDWGPVAESSWLNQYHLFGRRLLGPDQQQTHKSQTNLCQMFYRIRYTQLSAIIKCIWEWMKKNGNENDAQMMICSSHKNKTL